MASCIAICFFLISFCMLSWRSIWARIALSCAFFIFAEISFGTFSAKFWMLWEIPILKMNIVNLHVVGRSTFILKQNSADETCFQKAQKLANFKWYLESFQIPNPDCLRVKKCRQSESVIYYSIIEFSTKKVIEVKTEVRHLDCDI